MQDSKKTHFGFEEVPLSEKASRVGEVFHSVASRYDIMNDVMSGGLHRWWKRIALAECNAKPGHIILDVASGTGDLAAIMAKQVGTEGHVVLTDINDSMLAQGRLRMIDKGIINNVSYVQADAENLPFPNNHFDRITIAFGLRNVTQQDKALESMFRILKPGGKLLILEFSKVNSPLLRRLYDAYSFNIIPKMGEWITQDRKSYEYLVESIRMHPDQETLKTMMQQAGFEDVKYQNLTMGVVALHVGYKY
ncbi:MAG TPA: bifunctional demethylmenaquinone methyltransferase/2-methoxy-6-polyprenyl-1,4-benzoquinol methylase UbiE [Gammaproteobacteria bacterium]|nr:bifunctional demethylmenaquinone methyltransferase/2-methoxy-6-polyprenyl-1,4-benzoquinol methylase UbiE [Gammaproteobacteria bacterium]